MAIYLEWHMCSCHRPLVAQISICSDTFGQAEINNIRVTLITFQMPFALIDRFNLLIISALYGL